MSCKVIRWFKRQASLRKKSEKSDEKTQSSQNNSDEKKRTGFPRLPSFRRRHKKKTESAFEPQGTQAIVGISKQFSFSVPQEMESHTTKESIKNGVPTSTSMGFGSVSLTSSPSKSEWDKSTISELSDHSSFDCSKDSSSSPTSRENEKELEVNKEVKATPETSKASNCDNYNQTFHSVISSVAKDQPGSLLSKDCSASNTEAATNGAPIVRMEEICDNVSYTKHPEEIEKSHITDDSVMSIENRSFSSGSEDEVMGTNQVEECVNIIRNENEMLDLPTKEKDHSIKSESDVAIADTLIESNIVSPDPKEYNVFEEIERLMNDTICLVEEETNLGENRTKNKRNDNDNGSVRASDRQTNEGGSFVRSTDLSDPNLNGRLVIKNTSDCGEEMPAIANDLACETTNMQVEGEKNNDEDAMSQLNRKKVQCHSETMVNEDDINAPDYSLELQSSNTDKPLNEDLKAVTSVVRENEIENQSPNFCMNNVPKTIVNYYPKNLNPFGDDDSADEIAENRLNESNVKYNKKVTENLENGCYNKENDRNPFEEDTNVNRKSPNIFSRVNRRFVNSRHPNPNNEPSLRTSNKSLNPFGDSDDEDSSPLEENSRPGTEKETLHIPPQLPPKSMDRQNHRKNSQSSLAPIPYPRRSKPSHYGSYTSLQNMPTVPVPAPRSFTPSGSTRTLYESTNPFGDDCDDEDDGTSFERRGLERRTLQSGSSPCVPDSFTRSAATGSLPPALRIRGGKKKRKAPLPPKSSQNKSFANSCGPEEVTILPRARSSTSPESDSGRFNKKPPTGRAVSPLPPPRPPLPKSATPTSSTCLD